MISLNLCQNEANVFQFATHTQKTESPWRAIHSHHFVKKLAKSIVQCWITCSPLLIDSSAAKLERRVISAATGQQIAWIDAFNTSCNYPEINPEEVKREVNLFKSVLSQGQKKKTGSKPIPLHQVLEIYKDVPPTNLELIPNTHTLLQLLLTVPVTTATAGRSFSGLRRLKNL